MKITGRLPLVDVHMVCCSAGLGSLELYAMGLKATGSYLSRTLSYSGAEFNIAKEKIDPVFV